MTSSTSSDDLGALFLRRDAIGLRYQIERAFQHETLPVLTTQLRAIEQAHFRRRWGLFRRMLFEALNIIDFDRIDSGPLEIICEIKDTSAQGLGAAARTAALGLLKQQVRNGNTHFLDVNVLADTSAAVLAPKIVAVRRGELEHTLETGPVTPETLASTYYGYLYYSSHVRDPTGSRAGLIAFLTEAGMPTSTVRDIKDIPLDSEKVRFTNTSENSVALLRTILNLTDWNSSKRLEAATELGVICDSRAEGSLCTATRDQYPWVRRSAAEALGEIGQSRSVETLICSLWDLDSSVRERAEESLVQIGPSAVPSLIHSLEEHNGISRQEAIRLLASSHPRMLDSMAAAIEQVSAEARALAARALGGIGDARAVPSLEQALQSDDVSVRDAASAALRKIHEHARID